MKFGNRYRYNNVPIDMGERYFYINDKGYKENAGIFTHNNAWIICADAYAGRGEKAFEYYSKIAPAFNEEIFDLHKTEPYVYGQMVAGIDASRFGEGKNSWLTGTAAWNMVAISQYILGISPDFDGLKIDPSIPADWKEFKVKRIFRNTKFAITIKNLDGVNKGIKKVLVDKAEIDGNILKLFNDNKTHKVEVIMG